MKFFRFLVIISIVSLGLTFLFWIVKNSGSYGSDDSQKKSEEEVETTFTRKFEITEGATFGKLMEQASVTPKISQAIFQAAADVYDLSTIKLGKTIDLVYDKASGELMQLIYQIDSEEELYVTAEVDQINASSTEPIWAAERIAIPYEVKIKTAQGSIETSMYEAALEQGIDERAVIAFADVFQWSIDFAWEVRKGDTFKFIYEERYRDGEYVMPGKILAGKFVNDGNDIYAFYYEEKTDEEEHEGYFDQEGNSVEKVFLKAPLAFKYISSGFTTGQRYIEAFNISTGHRAVDYAAAAGTPIRAVGDGTIVFAGWAGAYGNKISVRHNSTYTTNYCHLSKFAVRYGQKVIQGQTIGYVGSTGLSTGPHLHYEMVKYGTKINPLLEEFPSAEGVKEENKEIYFESIVEFRKALDS